MQKVSDKMRSRSMAYGGKGIKAYYDDNEDKIDCSSLIITDNDDKYNFLKLLNSSQDIQKKLSNIAPNQHKTE